MRTVLLVVLFSVLHSSVIADQESRKATLSTGESVSYLLYEPKSSPDEKPPLLLFLHGGGESGDDIEKVKTHGPPKEIENGRSFSFFVISPQNPDKKGFWDEDRLTQFLAHLDGELHFDRKRGYLVGMSC